MVPFQSELHALKHIWLVPHSTCTVEARVSSTIFAYRVNSSRRFPMHVFLGSAHHIEFDSIFLSASFVLFYVLEVAIFTSIQDVLAVPFVTIMVPLLLSC